MRGERSSGTATVLFTDLVGSTELMSRLGDVAFDQLRGEHFTRMREAVTSAGGQEIKNTGDGILATFTSAVDALAAAVAAQQATDRQAHSADVPVSIRVGMSIGEVAFEEGDVFGTPVVEAARLVAAAKPGQILTTAVVRMLAGSRAGVDFTDLGPLALRGLPDPVPVCEVAWEPLPEAVPVPPLLTGGGRIFVGRDDPLGLLQHLWKEAAAGERRMALVAGEPGIGKTRLASELAAQVQPQGALVLAGRCNEDLGVPYQPFVEALRYYSAHAPVLRLGRYGGELTRLVPELAETVPDLPAPLRSDPETERYRLFDAVTSWLADASCDSPLLLVLDDIHWAAKPTLLLLRHILQSADPLSLLVVATYRDTEVGRGHPLGDLLAGLHRFNGVERVRLTGLDQAGVHAFLEAAAGRTLAEEDEDVARIVWSETEGHPFFVAEVLRHLAESGTVAQNDAGHWYMTTEATQLGIPQGVRDVVGQRLARLSTETNRVLAIASVVGLVFQPDVLLATGDMAEDELFAALEEAVAASLLVEMATPVAEYRFSHALVRATLYDELTAARRVALHRRVGVAIETVYGETIDDQLPALAHHWSRAAAPAAELTRAIDYSTRAGHRALGLLANDEALAYYRQALEMLDLTPGHSDDPRRVDLLISLGEAQRRSGDAAHRTTLLDAGRLAQKRGDAAAMARAALANTRGTFSQLGAVDVERVEALQAAADALGDAEPALRARLLAILAVELLWSDNASRRRALGDASLALARQHSNPVALGSVLLMRWASLWNPRWARERLELAAEVRAIAGDTGDPSLRFWGLWRSALASMELGRLDDAEALWRAAGSEAEELGQPFPRLCDSYTEVAVTLRSARLADAESLIANLWPWMVDTGQLDADILHVVQLAGLRYEQGRLGELEADLRDMVDRLPAVPFFRAMLSLALWEAGRPEDARSAFAPLSSGDPYALVGDDWFATPTMALLATLAAELGSTRDAAALSEVIAPYADQVASYPIWLGAFSHHLGRLAATLERFSDAEAHFRQAAATHERLGAPGSLARTRLEWARMLLRRNEPGDAGHARELLLAALAGARDLGLAGIERRAATLQA